LADGISGAEMVVDIPGDRDLAAGRQAVRARRQQLLAHQ